MSNSKFCNQQRQQERKRLKKLIVLSFISSSVLHGILAYTLPRWSFESQTNKLDEPIELIIVDKPKPKIESKPIVTPQPKPESEAKPKPIQTKTPPPIKPPEPVKAQTPPPKPIAKKVLTTPTPAPTQPKVSALVEDTVRPLSLKDSVTTPNNPVAIAPELSNSKPDKPESTVARNARPQPNRVEGISCVSNCKPVYPSALEGAEGSAGVKLTIDSFGNVISVELASANRNTQVNREALLAARQMKFSSPADSNGASVQVKIDFTVEGSEYDRLARKEQDRREKAARERREQEEAARQQQLEAERQARQQQLEQKQQLRSAPPSAENLQPTSSPLPALSESELEEERLRKFRERIENYQE